MRLKVPTANEVGRSESCYDSLLAQKKSPARPKSVSTNFVSGNFRPAHFLTPDMNTRLDAITHFASARELFFVRAGEFRRVREVPL